MAAVQEVFEHSWVGLGPKVAKFEKAWENHLGCSEAIALNSATAALHLALAVFNFPPGKKVLVPALTFSSTASAVLYNQLEPIFVDSDPETLCMDFKDLCLKYDKDCVAVIPVHYSGHPVEMEKLVPWAREKGLRIIEDCAHTTGSNYKGTMLGRWGDISCFSFEEKKLMTTGDGGMMCANDPDILKNVRAMRWVGIDKDNWKTAQKYTSHDRSVRHWFYEINRLGYKYNMNDLAAAIGLIQLEKLPNMNQKRAGLIALYVQELSLIPEVELLVPYDYKSHIYQIFGIRLDRRDELMLHLKEKEIATGCHYTPLSIQPLFEKWGGNCPYIEKEHERFITLPLHVGLSTDDVIYISKSIKDFFQE